MAKQGYMPPAVTVEWGTPQELFDRLDAEFGFTLDVCATKENAKCARYYNELVDGLKQSWAGHIVYCNPPYGRTMPKWIEKAYKEAQKSQYPVVMLIPSRTDTKAWHEYVMHAAEIRFIKGRLKYGDCAQSAPFPSAVIVFRAALDCKGSAPAVSSMPAEKSTRLIFGEA